LTAEQVVERFFAALSALDADRAGIRAWIGEIAESWQTFVIEVARLRRHDDVLIAIGVYEAEGRQTPFGEVIQRLPFASVIRVRDGLIRSIHSYARYEQAARAEGLPLGEPSLDAPR
jgi:ketosteroid isomerase-like protein